MSAVWRCRRGLAWLAPLVALGLGCATPGLPVRPPIKLDTESQRRRQEVARQFDESRELAELQSAQASYEHGDAKACEQSLRALLKRNPAHRDARLLLADVYLSGHRTTAAQEEIQKALQHHPHDAQVQYAMGLVLEMSNRAGEALVYYETAAKWEPDNEVYAVGYHSALEAAKRSGASTAISGGGPASASRAAQAESRPASAGTRSAGGADSGNPAGRADSAESAGVGAIDALLQKGDAALREGAAERALACFREAASLAPNNPQILISAATAALRENQPDLAVELLQPAAKRFAGSAPLLRMLGAAYYRLGDYQSSQVALQQALSVDKSSALSYFLMGCTLLKLGQRESAEGHLRQAQALDPRYTVRR